MNKSELLKQKANRLMSQSLELQNQANEFMKLAEFVVDFEDDIKEAKLAEIQLIADEIENEWLAEKIEERRKMKDRGEDIEVPATVEEMKQILSGNKPKK